MFRCINLCDRVYAKTETIVGLCVVFTVFVGLLCCIKMLFSNVKMNFSNHRPIVPCLVPSQRVQRRSIRGPVWASPNGDLRLIPLAVLPPSTIGACQLFAKALYCHAVGPHCGHSGALQNRSSVIANKS